MYITANLHFAGDHVENVAAVASSDPQLLLDLAHARDGSLLVHTECHWVVQIPGRLCVVKTM